MAKVAGPESPKSTVKENVMAGILAVGCIGVVVVAVPFIYDFGQDLKAARAEERSSEFKSTAETVYEQVQDFAVERSLPGYTPVAGAYSSSGSGNLELDPIATDPLSLGLSEVNPEGEQDFAATVSGTVDTLDVTFTYSLTTGGTSRTRPLTVTEYSEVLTIPSQK